MKILALETTPSSNLGGQELSLLDVCNGLAQRGHEIHLLFQNDGDLLAQYDRFIAGRTKVARYAVDRHRVSSSLEWIGALAEASCIDVDVIYANQYHDTLFGGVLGRVKRRPLVCHLRLMPPIEFCRQHRIGTSLAVRFIANSAEVKKRYVSIGIPAERIDVVFNGIDLRAFAPAVIDDQRARFRTTIGIPCSAFVISYVGRIDPGKGIETLVRAVAALPPNVWLLVVGSPVVHRTVADGAEYVESLKSLATAEGVSARVRWLGRRHDVPRIFQSSDVAVLSTEGEEAFGRVLIEAMACGIPAIGARCGGVPEILSEDFQRFLFAPRDPGDLARVLGGVLRWRQEDPMLGERCRAHVARRFTVERMVTGVERTLMAVCG